MVNVKDVRVINGSQWKISKFATRALSRFETVNRSLFSNKILSIVRGVTLERSATKKWVNQLLDNDDLRN